MTVLKSLLSVWLIGLFIAAGSVNGQTDIPSDAIRSVQWSPSGDAIAVGTEGDGLKVYDAETLDAVFEFTDRSDAIHVVEWSPSGAKLAAGIGNKIYVWQTGSYQLLYTLTGHANPVQSLAWSPDESRLVSGNLGGSTIENEKSTFKFWDLANGQVRLSRDYAPAVLSWDHTSNRLVGWYPLSLYLIDPVSGESQLLCQTCRADAPYDVKWSPDGRVIAIATRNYIAFRVPELTTQTGIESKGIIAYSITWSPNSEQIASGDSTGKVRIWDVETQTLVEEFHTDNDEVYAVDWSPDGARIAYGGANGVLEFYDAANLEAIQP